MASVIRGSDTFDSSITGTILQVVSKTISTQGSQTIAVTDTQIGTGDDFQISITPKGNNSKFIVSVRWFGEISTAWEAVFNILRDGARINTTNNLNYHGLSMPTTTYQAGDNNSTPDILNLQTLDSTGSTKGILTTYTLVCSDFNAATMWTNRCFGTVGANYETGISELMVMEVAG